MSLSIPDNLKPDKVEQVMVPVVNDPVNGHIESIIMASKEMGLTVLSGRSVKNILALGVAAEGLGVEQLANGYVLMTQAALAKVIERLGEHASKDGLSVEDLDAIAKPLGYTADRMHKLTKGVLADRKARKEAEFKPAAQQSFVPGASVFQQQVNNFFGKPPEQVLDAEPEAG